MNRNMLKQMQQLQAKILRTQEELASETVEGSAGGGAVRIVMTGHQKVQAITIDPEAAEDIELLQDMLVTAFNDAQEKVAALIQKRMGPLTGGLGIPGL
ncbi:MAG: YbaB/EbfC family nucleoid-associated protein [Chloroflexota bacterium]|nr:YbaB/EbfC family nucleoid-associated protein [Dehalococcoidia bacterium]MDW8252771.1 YbaB/EbfC family nucleoid-associated protein [Chloroflexota bacterium]